MKNTFLVILIILSFKHQAQTPFNDLGKWGLREADNIVVPPVYDTVFGFDPGKQVCLACHRIVTTSGSGFVRIKTTSYSCNYLNPKNDRLVVKNSFGDTSSVFSLGRSSVRQYNNTSDVMTVSVAGKRHLVRKNFIQLTFKGYHHIEAVPGIDLYRCEYKSESGAVYTGMVSKDERPVIPFRYSSIGINRNDSLIIACSAGFKGTDDVYEYSGKKVISSSKHVMYATRRIVVEKQPEVPGRFSVVNRADGKETAIEADELVLSDSATVRFRKKKNWYHLDPRTGKRIILKNL